MSLSQSIHHILFRAVGGTSVANEARNMERSFRGVDEASRRLRGGLLGMTTTLAGSASLFTVVGLALRRTVQQYTEFEAANARLRVVLLSGGAQLRTTHELTSQLAQSVARDLGYSLNEGTDAMKTMMETGLGTHRSMRIFRTALDLARVGEMRSSDAIEFLTDTMNMFQGEMARTGEEIGPFSRRMSAQLVAAANLASTSVDDLRQAFRYAGTELSTLGYGSRDIMATLSGLSQLGLRGSMGGVRLRAAMGALINPSQRTLALFREYGIQEEEVRGITYDNAGQQRNLLEIMLQLHGLMARIPDRQRRAQLEMQMFGTRSLAAGISMAEFNAAAQRAREIFRELQGDVTQVFNRQVEERMRGFDMQMTQLKESANDLAISFGQILVTSFGRSGQTFGSYMRQVSEGVMLLGNLGSANSENRQRWKGLSPEIRRTATEVRNFLISAARTIRTMVRWGVAISRFVRDHRTLIEVLIGMRVVMGTWSSLTVIGIMGPATAISHLVLAARGIPVVIGNVARLISLLRMSAVLSAGQTLLGFTSGWQAIGGARGLLNASGYAGLIGPMGLIGALGLLAVSVRSAGIAITGTQGELDMLRRTSIGLASTWLEENIPVLGQFLSIFTDLIAAIQEYNRLTNQMASQNARYAQNYVSASASYRMGERMRTLHGGTEAERRTRAGGLELSESVQRAALSLAGTRNSIETISTRLLQSGLSADMISRVVREIERLRANPDEATQGDIQRMQQLYGNTRDSWVRVMRETIIQLQDFQNVLGQTGGIKVPTAQDAFIRRGGVLGVSSGDVVVSRDSLASALMERRGGILEGLGGNRTVIGPPSVSGSTGGGEITIVVPLTIDGREIARAVGRANVRQLERGGARIGPEQRRSMHETGFARALR